MRLLRVERRKTVPTMLLMMMLLVGRMEQMDELLKRKARPHASLF